MTPTYKECTRLYRCSDYPRRVRAESPGHAAGIVARYLARKRHGRSAFVWRTNEDGWSQNRATGRTVACHYAATVCGRGSLRSGYPILGQIRLTINME
jgi:hypothetical protein